MSKHMQLSVTVIPYYQRDLEGTYPKLERHLRYLDPSLANRNPSLYELVGQLDQLLYRLEGTKFREVLLRHREKLLELHKIVQENIASCNIAQVDQHLYGIEDIFNDIESELD